MPFDPEDPRLTAYALGELEPADRAAIETLLRDDPDGRAFVVGIEETAQLLTQELGHESTATPGLDLGRRGAIEDRLSAATLPLSVKPRAKSRRRFRLVELAVAASILGIAVSLLLPAVQSSRSAARRARAKVELADAEPRQVTVNERSELETSPAPARSTAPVQRFSRFAAPAPAASRPSIERRSSQEALLATSPDLDRPPAAPAASLAGGRSILGRVGSPTSAEEGFAYKSESAPASGPPVALGLKKRTRDKVAGATAGGGMGGMGGGMGGMGAPGRGMGQGPAGPGLGELTTVARNRRVSGLGMEVPVGGPQAGTGVQLPSRPNTANALQATNAPAPYGNAQSAPAPDPAAKPGEATSYRLEPAQAAQAVDGLALAKSVADAKAGVPAINQVTLADAAKAPLSAVEAESVKKTLDSNSLLQAQIQPKAAADPAQAGREAYARFYDNPFVNVVGNELSTFSIDVDTAAYANVRRFLSQGQLPPVDAVRIEELINYFTYDDPAPTGDAPFSVNCEVAACPWEAGHRLLRIGLKGKTIAVDKRPASNLVFLIDVSGSMTDLNKLPLLKAGMKLLVEQLGENDRVAIVTYANGTRIALPSTSCDHKAEILAALEELQAGGGTNGGAGIELACQQAAGHFIKGGTNRVILGTDGDFNVGVTKEELLTRCAERARGGIFLSVLGFGEGNLQDNFMEQLADKGNGNYSYIDTIQEARKVLVQQMTGTLNVIAKDVKIQLEFNPAKVSSYRLIGYENRVMANEDFRNDKKDAGEIGAGHSVTALYEIVPAGKAVTNLAVADRPLKYSRKAKADAPAADEGDSPETLTVALRYKKPDGDVATEISKGITDDSRDFGHASNDLKFSAAVAGFGMLLRESPYKGKLGFPAVREIASGAVGADKSGYRKEFLGLVDQAGRIVGQ